MRVTPMMTSENALYNIQEGRARLDRLNEQISAGLNILRPSDDPITSRQILDLQNKVKEGDQYLSNITKSNLWLDFTETALQGVSDVLNNIKGVASTISSGTTDTAVRTNSVSQLKEMRKQLLDMANVQLGDQYIFGGYKNSTLAVAGDTNGTTGIANIDVTNLSVGMAVSGDGIPANTVINSIGPGNAITLNNSATASGSGVRLTFGPPFNAAPFAGSALTGDLNGTNSITGLDTSTLSVGMPVSGEGIPAGTKIAAIPASGTITLDTPATITKTGASLLFGGNFRGTDDKVQVEVSRSSKVEINVSGSELFSGTGTYGSVDLFAALDGLIAAIESNNVPAIQLNAADLDKGSQQVSNARSDVAGRMTRLLSTKKMVTRDQNTAKSIISERQNVDYAKAAIELTQQQTAFEAALSATAKISQLSLLDYLK